MANASQPDRLKTLLLDHLDATTVQRILSQLSQAQEPNPVLELLEELGEISSKVQGEAVSALGEVGRRECLSSVIPWLDVGITLTQATGALGLRYFKESPTILGFLGGTEQRDELLARVLELADGPTETARTMCL